MCQRSEILIALVKDGETDIVKACSWNEEVGRLMNRSPVDVVGRKSSETWPDYNGKRYRFDDKKTLEEGQNFGIVELVRMGEQEIAVVTDKLRLDGDGNLIMVLVYRRRDGLGYSENGYSVAKVAVSNWSPESPSDVPMFTVQDIRVYVSSEIDIPLMSLGKALELCEECNAEIFQPSKMVAEWHVVLVPGYTTGQ